MKLIMMSTILMILAMTCSCTEKNSNISENANEAVIEVVQKAEFEDKTPDELSSKEEVKVENQVSNPSSKPNVKKVNLEKEKISKKVIPVEKVAEEKVEEEPFVNGNEKSVIVEKQEKKEVAKSETVISKSQEIKKEVAVKPDHSVFNNLLQNHVSSKGVVNYAGLKKDIGKLDSYLADLDKSSVASDWSKNEKLAYWINAYNAFTIKLILDNYPVKSIQDINGGKPWDKKWISLGGKTYSLNQIENDIIRPEFGEPRIHFAVNCAAQSCPPLANKAFTAENLNSLLEKQTKTFINNSRFNTITNKSVTISKIFDWYGVDFGDKIAFLNKFSTTEISSNAKIGYSEYDWGLNNK